MTVLLDYRNVTTTTSQWIVVGRAIPVGWRRPVGDDRLHYYYRTGHMLCGAVWSGSDRSIPMVVGDRRTGTRKCRKCISLRKERGE